MEILKGKNRKLVSYKIKQKHVDYALQLLEKHNELSIYFVWSKLKEKFDDFNVSQGYFKC